MQYEKYMILLKAIKCTWNLYCMYVLSQVMYYRFTYTSLFGNEWIYLIQSSTESKNIQVSPKQWGVSAFDLGRLATAGLYQTWLVLTFDYTVFEAGN